MSLYSTATSANLYRQRGPVERADSLLTVMFASGLSIPVWITDTLHEDAYSYVGMSEAAAQATAAAMNGSTQVQDQPAPLRLTITVQEVTVTGGVPTITTVTKQIQTGVAVATYMGGGMWSVDVQISYTTQSLELA